MMRVIERISVNLPPDDPKYEAGELWRTEDDCYYIASQIVTGDETAILDSIVELIAGIGGIDLAESFPDQPYGLGRETIVFAANEEGKIESWTAIVGGKGWTIADALAAFEAL